MKNKMNIAEGMEDEFGGIFFGVRFVVASGICTTYDDIRHSNARTYIYTDSQIYKIYTHITIIIVIITVVLLRMKKLHIM